MDTISNLLWDGWPAVAAAAGAVVLLRSGMLSCLNGRVSSDVRLQGRVVVITGANIGIGLETAADLYSRGARVILACRDSMKAEMARKEIVSRYCGERGTGELDLVRLDLSSLKSVRNAAAEILNKESRIDILINNAGIMMCPFSLTEDGYELQFATNHLGHFLFTMLLLPRILRVAATKPESEPSKIINLSSIAHGFVSDMFFEDINLKMHYAPTRSYYRSKAANVFFTKALAKRLQGTNVRVYAVHPGIVDTPLWKNVDYAIIPGANFVMRRIAPLFIKSAKDGAQTSIYCAIDPRTNNQTGLYYADCKVKEPSSFVKNEEVSDRLYDLSLELVKLDTSRFDPFQPESSVTMKLRSDNPEVVPTIDLVK